MKKDKRSVCSLSQIGQIKELWDLTDKFTSLLKGDDSTWTYYNTEGTGGRAGFQGIIKIPGVLGVAVLYMHDGQVFPKHKHPGEEWGLVLTGALELYTNGEKEIKYKNKMFSFNANKHKAHGGKAVGETVILFVTTNPMGYPNGRISI